MRSWVSIVAAALAAALLAAGGCSEPTAAEQFADNNATFLSPPAGQLNLRYLKYRDSAPAGHHRKRLEAEFFPKAEGWRSMGHEVVVPADALLRIDVGDRVDLRDEDDWPLADDTTSGPAWLIRARVHATAGTPVVVMSGHRGLHGDVLRVVVIGEVGTVGAEGAEMSPRVTDPTLPPAFVLERIVPEAHRPGRNGSFPGAATGRFGANAKFLHMPFPMQGRVHLTSWVHMPAAGGSSTSVQNDLHSHEWGDILVRSDGIDVSVQIAGEEADWTTFPHALWTVRMFADTPPR